MSENIARTPREGLDQQITELAALRNAGTRAPQFRAWRQATLTLIQRIFPGDASYSERFRRIPFSTNNERGETNELREVYEKGCAEAVFFLRELRDRVGDVEWAEIDNTGHSTEFEVGSTEDDFPTLDLPPGRGGATAPRPGPKPRGKAKGGRTREASLGDLLKQAETKPARGGAPRLPEAEVIPPPEPAPKPRTRKTTPGTRRAKPRLKDMLGFEEGAAAPDVSVAPEPPPPPPPVMNIPQVPPPAPPPPVMMAPPEPPPVVMAPPPPPPLPVVTAPMLDLGGPPAPTVPAVPSDLLRELETPRTPPPIAVQPPAPPAATRTPTLNELLMTPDFTARLEASLDPEEPADEDVEYEDEEETEEWPDPNVPGPAELAAGLPPAPPVHTPAPPIPPQTTHRGTVFTAPDAFGPPAPARPAPPPQFVAPPPPPAAAAPPRPPAPPVLPIPEADPTEEFLRNSPVLSSLARPVRRNEGAAPSPPPAFTVSEAIEILALAGIVAEFGVPEHRLQHARTSLAELARHLENGDLTWQQLREAVHFLLEFPPLARRILPLLLPFLDDAA